MRISYRYDRYEGYDRYAGYDRYVRYVRYDPMRASTRMPAAPGPAGPGRQSIRIVFPQTCCTPRTSSPARRGPARLDSPTRDRAARRWAGRSADETARDPRTD